MKDEIGTIKLAIPNVTGLECFINIYVLVVACAFVKQSTEFTVCST